MTCTAVTVQRFKGCGWGDGMRAIPPSITYPCYPPGEMLRCSMRSTCVLGCPPKPDVDLVDKWCLLPSKRSPIGRCVLIGLCGAPSTEQGPMWCTALTWLSCSRCDCVSVYSAMCWKAQTLLGMIEVDPLIGQP